MTANGWTPMRNGDVLLAELHHLDEEEERRRRLLMLGAIAAVALHALLLALVPRGESSPAPIRFELNRFTLEPTPRFAPPPPAPAPPAVAPARRVPMPDPTPDTLEPIAALDAQPLELSTPVDTDLIFVPAPPAPPEAPAFYEVDGEVLAPRRSFAPEPVYPRPALLVRREATVILQARIDAHGRVVALAPLTQNGFGFEESAIAAVTQWRFHPATRHGEPVPVSYRLTVRFRLTH